MNRRLLLIVPIVAFLMAPAGAGTLDKESPFLRGTGYLGLAIILQGVIYGLTGAILGIIFGKRGAALGFIIGFIIAAIKILNDVGQKVGISP